MVRNENSYQWLLLDLSEEMKKFLSRTAMSIAPQVCRSNPENIIYLQEMSSTGRIARSVGIYILDFENSPKRKDVTFIGTYTRV